MNTKHSFLQGGGKMGELIRAKDWSKTPLGEPKTWSQSLRSLIPVVLENPFGMYIAWGKDYTQIYNDACGPILGNTKHPKALGLSTRETFSEVWHIIDGMFEKVMNGEAIAHRDFKLQLERNGYLETCYFDLAYSPIKTESGEVGGVLVTVIETTNKRKAEEEHNESKNELEFVIESAQLGIFDYNPLTNKFTANTRLKSWFGLPSEEQIELPDAINSIADTEKEKITAAIQKALEYSSGGFYDEKFSVINPFSKKETIVHAKGKAWFNQDKVAYRLNGTLEDVTEQILASRKKMETEQHLRTMVLESPVGICVIDADTLVSEIANESFIDIAGKPHDAIVGKFYWDTFAEVRAEYETALNTVIETGKPFNANEEEVLLIRHGREESIYLTFVYSPLKDENGKVIKVAVWVLENTMQVESRKKIMVSENNLRLMILQAPMAISIFRGDEYKVEIANKYALELWGRTEEQVLNISIFDSMPELKTQGIKEMLDGVSKTGNRFATSEQPIQLYRKGLLETVYINFSYEAIYDGDGKINGIMAIGFDVTQQVVARKNVEESETRYNLMLMQSPFAFLILKGKDMVVHLANESMIEVLGKGPDIEGKPLLEILPEIKEQVFPDLLNSVLTTGVPVSHNETLAKLVRNGNKESVYLNYVFQPYYEADETISGVTVIAYDVTDAVVAKKEIEISEKRYHNLIHSSPSAIGILYGEDLTITIANEAIIDIWGKNKDIIGKPYFEAMPELAEQGYKEIFTNVYQTGIPFTAIETPVNIEQNGEMTLKYYNFIVYPQRNLDGNVDGLGIISTEVTSQAILNNKIKESEQSIRTLVESAPFPIGVYEGEEMRISLANQSIMDAWGKGNDVIGKLYSEVLPELENQKIYEQIRGVLKTGITFQAVNQRVDLVKDGGLKPYYFNYNFTPLFNTSGEVYAVMNTAADVTELNEAQQKIEESEKRFRDSVRQAPLGIVILRGPDNITEMANESYLLLVDKTKEQFVGKPLFETLPEVKETIAPIIANIYKTGNAFYGNEFPIKLKRQGETVTAYFNFVYQPLKENNVITGLMVVATEVTATVTAKNLIAENEEKLKIIIDASELGVWDYNIKTEESTLSERCHEILGFPGEHDLPHAKLVANLHPDDLDIREKAFQEAFNSGFLHYEIRVIWKDKSIHWMETKGKVFYDAKNEPERMLGTIRDVTEERNFQQELLEREEKFRLLADSMPQHIWTSDREGNLNYFNQSVFDFSGLTLEQINKDGWIQIVHPDDREENIKQWTYAIKTGNDFLCEHRFRKHNGEYRWQLSRATPQKDTNGLIKMWVGSSTDIQEQKMFTTELERQVKERTNELNQKNIDLESINKELQSFVYISSHDLQEPLRKIQTFSSRILDSEYETLSANAKKYFSRMQQSAHRMQNLIQDLFAYSRTSVQERKFEIVNLLEIIEDIQETLKEELEQNNVSFELINLCEVKIITFQFKQLIINLISNSIKFARVEEPMHIKISCAVALGAKFGIEQLVDDKEYCHISIADNGIGFEQQYNERIFEVFQRLHGKDEYDGTGIGLAIVKKIVDNHHGIITAKGQLNKGATFNIYIPV